MKARFRKRPEPADVLAGRASADPAMLMELIHQVNPTGLTLSAAERAERYRLKASLQSLLIQRFPEAVAVELEPGQEGVVRLLARHTAQNGCHAILDELDEDARSWIRTQLDLGAGSPSIPPPVPSEQLSDTSELEQEPEDPLVMELIGQGLTAMDSYDFEAARWALHQAVLRSPGSLGAAQLLLTLLVDHLAADSDALLLASRLAPDVVAYPDVRVLLGMAAARTGDFVLARRFVRALEHPKTAAVLACLAVRAAEQRDKILADSVLAELKLRDPAHPALRTIPEMFVTQAREQRAPEERELERLLADGHLGEVEQRATTLLAEHPGSSTAAKVLQNVRAARRRAQAQEALRDAEAALRATDLVRAAALARHAVQLADDETLRSTATTLLMDIERLQLTGAQQKVLETVALFTATSREEAVRSYARLNPKQRAQIRQQVSDRAISWIEQLLEGNKRLTHAAVEDAVLALMAAEPLRLTQPQRFLAAVWPHERILSRLAEARSWLAEAQRCVSKQRMDKAAARLQQARTALQQGNPTEAASILESVAAAELSANHAPELPALAKLIESALKRAAAISQLEAAEASDNHFATFELADDLSKNEQDPERDRWLSLAAHAQQRLQRDLDFTRTEPLEAPEGLQALQRAAGEGVPRWITPDGRRLLLTSTETSRVIVCVVDIDDGKIAECISLRAPTELTGIWAELDDNRLWIAGQEGMFSLTLDEWRILSWISFRDLGIDPKQIKNIRVAAGGEFVWLELDDSLAVVDVRGPRKVRRLPGCAGCHLIVGGPKRYVVTNCQNKPVLVVERGMATSANRIDIPDTALAAAAAPLGNGIVVGGPGRFAGDGVVPIHLGGWQSDGRPRPVKVIDHSDCSKPFALASCRSGMLVVSFWTHDGRPALMAFEYSAKGKLEALYRIVTSAPLGLAQDSGAHHIAALYSAGGKLKVVRIGREQPEVSS